jgi:uncharacterized protein YqeY
MVRDDLVASLKEAMKAKDKRKTATLRLILAAIKDRDIASRSDGSGDGVSDEEILQILSKMIRQRRESITMYEEGGRLELAEQEREEIGIIEQFLPRQMDEVEIEAACARVIDETGASCLKDIGRVMGALKSRHAGEMDFAKASAVVKRLLS